MGNLQRIRKEKGMSQAKLAAAVGITPGAVGQYEMGVTTPSLKTAMAIATALGCTVDELFREEVRRDA